MTATSTANQPPIRKEKKRSERTKRVNLILPLELHEELTAIAIEGDITTLELLRKFIKLGVIAYKVGKKENSALIIREGETEREIVLI